jgi:hypothetical protein
MVRPKTIERLLRVTASVRLLVTAVGEERARTLLMSGSPNLLDRLSGSSRVADRALRTIAEEARPALVSPPERVTDVDAMLARLHDLDAAADAWPDDAPLGDAAQVDGANDC